MLDLVYGAIAWGTAREYAAGEPESRRRTTATTAQSGRSATGGGSTSSSSLPAATLYIHCGGLEGLPTSLRRYERAGLLREGESAEDALRAARRDVRRLMT